MVEKIKINGLHVVLLLLYFVENLDVGDETVGMLMMIDSDMIQWKWKETADLRIFVLFSHRDDVFECFPAFYCVC